MKKLREKPYIFDGVHFFSYRVGINRYALISADGRIDVRLNGAGRTYRAVVDNVTIGRLYRSRGGAVTAGIKSARVIKL